MVFAAPPDPARARSLDDLVEALRLLKIWAGDPSYEVVKDRINKAWTAAGQPPDELTVKSTVASCFRPGRRRMNPELLVAVVQALHPDVGYAAQWREALRVIGGEIEAVSQVRVQGSLPGDLTGFVGRERELGRLRDSLQRAGQAGAAVVISAIEGMAGVGKTQLAIHAAHFLVREKAVDHVLFVNLRGFHPDPTQPPADPAAVLDGFLRLLDVPGHEIPHGLAARSAAYRKRIAGTRTLVVLDNAATVDQVRPLLPATPGCLTVITSRRRLADLHPATHLGVDVYSAGEALTFLTDALAGTPLPFDAGAAARIAHRCGYLPLALSLIAGHIRNTAGWTLADHADRLDDRHRQQRLDTGVELALDLSYQHTPGGHQRLLRLAALHPGQDLDAYAAAALTGGDLDTVRAGLERLHDDHLLQQVSPGRYTFHDLVRAYATTRAHDQDPPAERRAALTRLFDHYLATGAAAMDTMHPAEAQQRPEVQPAATAGPDLSDPDAAASWLDTERHSLLAVTGHAATHGWPRHATSLARTLSRYFRGGYHSDAEMLHDHAYRAARASGDVTAQAHALVDLASAHQWLGHYEPAAGHAQRALALFRRLDDPAGQAGALYVLSAVEGQWGRSAAAVELKQQAAALYRQAGDRSGEVKALADVGVLLGWTGRHREAVDYFEQTLTLARQIGHIQYEACALQGLGDAGVQLGRYGPAADCLRQALALYRSVGSRTSEAGALDSLGTLYTRIKEFALAVDCHQQALTHFRELSVPLGEAWALNGLGEAVQAAGRPADAVAHHAAAQAIAADIGAREVEARAHAGLGHANHTLGNHAKAQEHYGNALALYTDLDAPEADEIRARLVD